MLFFLWDDRTGGNSPTNPTTGPLGATGEESGGIGLSIGRQLIENIKLLKRPIILGFNLKTI